MTTPDAARVPAPEGLELLPFRALRFTPAAGPLADLLSPPYDVIDEAGVVALEQRNPHNVVRLILPRDTDGEGSRYAEAAASLATWRADGVLAADHDGALYVYEMATTDHVQRGLVGGVSLSEPEAGIVLPHENTMAGPVADRLALAKATEANLEPIFLVYDGGGAASAAVAAAGDLEPLLSVTTADGVTHRLWALTDPDVLAGIAADLAPRRAVIADGHHRYATYRRHQADEHAGGAGRGPWDQGLAFLVDSSAFGPQVHAIHRVVPDLRVAEAAERAQRGFAVRTLDGSLDEALTALAQAGKAGAAFVLADGAQRVLLTDPDPELLARAVPPDRSGAWRELDVTVAHYALIRALWGLEDTEDVVWFRHDVDSALRDATASHGTALLLNPTPVDAVVAVAAAGDRMPRKSTLFTPKPATGLVLRTFDDNR